MHSYHREMPRLVVVAFALVWAPLSADDSLATLVVPPPAATTEWVRAPGDPGSWFDASNWSDGVPDKGSVAEIADGGEAAIRRGFAKAEILRLVRSGPDFSLPANHLLQSGGRLSISNELSIEDGRYDLERGHLSTGSLRLGRVPLPILVLPQPPPVPWELPQTISLSPEETATEIETSEPELMDEVVFPDWPVLTFRFPVQQFHQSGGRTNIDRRLSIYSGGVQVSGGRLQADSILIDAWPIFGIVVPGESESDRTPVSGMSQSDGYVRVADSLLIQNGSYRLSGGRLRADRIAVGESGFRVVPRFQLPKFIQTGGVNHVTGDLELRGPGVLPGLVLLSPVQTADYRLEGGLLAVDGDVIVGRQFDEPHESSVQTFLHSAGRARIGGTLRIQGDSSHYSMSGGRLSTHNLEIGREFYDWGPELPNSGGKFTLFKPAHVTVKNRISFGRDSVFEARHGSRLRLTGEKFENFSNDDAKLAGFNNLELTVDSGFWNLFHPNRGNATEFEVGGRDLGAVDQGFVKNFALDTLRVGGLSPAHLRLVDLEDNQPNSAIPEALYVDHLVVARGSTLELGGIAIYYRTAQIFGNVINSTLTLASTSQVPEPASVLLLCLGCVVLSWKRQRSDR